VIGTKNLEEEAALTIQPSKPETIAGERGIASAA
jgi:hypothetical protein